MQSKDGYYKVLLAAVIWGTIGAFARWSGLNPLELSFLRLSVASLAMFAFLPREQRLVILHAREYLPVFLCGIMFAVDCLLFFYALQLTTISNAVIPYNTQPVFITLLTPLFFKERLERGVIIAFILSLTGVGLLLAPSIVSLSLRDVAGIIFALAGALLLSVIALIAKRVNIGATTFVYYEMLIASVCLLPFFRISSPLTAKSVAIVICIGLVHTAIGYVFYYDGLRKVKIQYAITLSYFAPVVAGVTGYFLFGEAIGGYTIVGGLLIILNGLLVLFRR